VVEDEYFIGISDEDALIEAGFTVVAIATNAAEGIRLAVVEMPDLVLMDIRLGEGPDGVRPPLKSFSALEFGVSLRLRIPTMQSSNEPRPPNH
jgi:hypothetical protein